MTISKKMSAAPYPSSFSITFLFSFLFLSDIGVSFPFLLLSVVHRA